MRVNNNNTMSVEGRNRIRKGTKRAGQRRWDRRSALLLIATVDAMATKYPDGYDDPENNRENWHVLVAIGGVDGKVNGRRAHAPTPMHRRLKPFKSVLCGYLYYYI